VKEEEKVAARESETAKKLVSELAEITKQTKKRRESEEKRDR